VPVHSVSAGAQHQSEMCRVHRCHDTDHAASAHKRHLRNLPHKLKDDDISRIEFMAELES